MASMAKNGGLRMNFTCAQVWQQLRPNRVLKGPFISTCFSFSFVCPQAKSLSTWSTPTVQSMWRLWCRRWSQHWSILKSLRPLVTQRRPPSSISEPQSPTWSWSRSKRRKRSIGIPRFGVEINVFLLGITIFYSCRKWNKSRSITRTRLGTSSRRWSDCKMKIGSSPPRLRRRPRIRGTAHSQRTVSPSNILYHNELIAPHVQPNEETNLI